MKKSLMKLLAVLSAMLFVVSAHAQVTTSTLSGKVSDASGAVIGAPVVAVYTPTGTTYYGVSDKNGSYRINGANPGGPYSVTVEMLGYRKVTITDIYASLGENNIINFDLEEEALGLEAAVFTADAVDSKMNIQRSGVGTSINHQKMENIPTVSRSMNDIMKLTPQASTTTNGFAVGGGNYRGSSVTVDGAAFNNAFGIGSNLPAGGSPISLDAIEQMTINITPFDVRQSGFQGGAINAVTKSGSNEFHASAYNYYTSEKVRGAKVDGVEIANSKALNNTIGFTVGGPIIKNKLFYFVNAEYSLDNVPGSKYEASTDGAIKGIYNRPTASELDNIKSFLSDKFNYNPGRYQGYSLSTPDYKILARLDWNINDNNKLNLRISHTHTYGSNQPSSSMSPIGGTNSSYTNINGESVYFNRYSAGRQSQYTMYFESARYFQEQNFTSLAAELNSRLFDGKANNVLRFTYSHQDEPRSYVGDFFPTVDILSNKGVSGSDTYAMFTTFGLDPFTYGNLRDVQTVIGTDELTYSAGIHNLIGGVQVEWNRATNGYMQGGSGWFIYDSWDNFVADVTNPGTNTGPVAFMITHANLDDPTSQAFPAFDYTQASLYAQDEMNISDYFKLTAGLRLEMPFITIPTDNFNKDFAAAAAANPSSSFAGLSTDMVPNPSLSVSPRIGFNWDVFKDRSVIVRGGTGIFTGRIPNVWLVSAIGNSNVLQYQYINKNVVGSGSNAEGIHFSNDRSQIIKNLYAGNAFKKQDLSAPTATTIISDDLVMPSSWKSSAAIDLNFPEGMKATFEGIYSYSFNEVYATSLGYKETGTVKLPGEPSSRSLWTSEDVKNNAGKVMNGYYVRNVDDLHGQYVSLSAQVSKDWTNGLSLMAAYTYSNSLTASDGNGDQISEFANIYTANGCNVPELGYASYVAPHRAIASASYTIKEGPHAATKLGLFYEGYNIGFYSSYSYSRMSYLMNNVSGAGSASQLIYIPTDSDLNAMPFTSDANKSEYKSFIESDNYLKNHRGEYMKRNAVAAPWLNRFNLKLAEDFYFNVAGKKHTLEIAADVNNLGNLINNSWGVYKQISTTSILSYANGAYTFTKPEWSNYNDITSTWQLLFSVRYSF
ncbi:MAG: TonB-dependent receptor [Bacteroidia bacterium]|nr:TonB-dependent receptor [Bacteroidia bacterium]